MRIDPDAVRAAGRHADDADHELATARQRADALAEGAADLGAVGPGLARVAAEVRDLLDELAGSLTTHRVGLVDGAAALADADRRGAEDARAVGR